MWKFLSAVLCVIFVSPKATAESGVWVAAKDEKRIFIAGSSHMVRQAAFPLPLEYRKALSDASRIVLETDVAKISTAEFSREAMERFTLPVGQTLEDRLDYEAHSSITKFISRIGLSYANIKQFTPGYVSILVSARALYADGRTVFLDLAVFERARSLGKEIIYLESPQEQLKALESYDSEDPNKLIISTIDGFSASPSIAERMEQDILSGDVSGIKGWLDEMRDEMPSVYESLIVRRNGRWIKKIDAVAAMPGTSFVLVGGLHLVGEHGILTSLESLGYSISKY